VDLLESYLQAVKPLLPRKAHDDILRELSENIRGQMEEKEADLGRPLTDAEQEEVISSMATRSWWPRATGVRNI
jgi:hypothetical protein